MRRIGGSVVSFETRICHPTYLLLKILQRASDYLDIDIGMDIDVDVRQCF